VDHILIVGACPRLGSGLFYLFELDTLGQPFLHLLDELGRDFAELLRQLRLSRSRLDNVHQLQDSGGQLELGEVDWPWPGQMNFLNKHWQLKTVPSAADGYAEFPHSDILLLVGRDPRSRERTRVIIAPFRIRIVSFPIRRFNSRFPSTVPKITIAR
jgi:hypothetical protein